MGGTARQCDHLEQSGRWGGSCALGFSWLVQLQWAAPSSDRSTLTPPDVGRASLAQDGSHSHWHSPYLPGEPHLHVHILLPAPVPE